MSRKTEPHQKWSSSQPHVVAEGVERPAHAEVLHDLGCRSAQGFLFGRPAPLAALHEDLLAGSVPATAR
ncbi:EAL domain-containing protein [Geodermatophilus sp. TF02-6]|uniref:EAL domain-containing protein n=1 Tax=Geodermatophilus sp. TF02-6 TaxID=2250575 RepID=UPI001F1C27B1|nr:EAL domain-containing protein [Geodermatophilus sp. TF02-6]